MAVSGTLAIKVIVKPVTCGNSVVKDAADSEEITIEVLQQHQEKPLVATKLQLADFLTSFAERKMTFTFGSKAAPSTVQLFFGVEWTAVDAPTTVLATETHRPWFMRALYYYDTSKTVYNYTTSFRVVAPFARLGEATVNTVLTKVSGKTLHDLDQALVAPALETVDEKVDGTISIAFTKLYEGQQLALKTKDAAVSTASAVAHKTVETASTAVGATVHTAVRAKDYTTGKVVAASSAVYGTVANVADYTSSQVVHASSSTYGVVRGVTYAVAQHVPILGPKIRA
ncbi:hypothetical protein BBJ28_00008996 [Nothophytophthora sp. Chile5]|nr:hypothetical protein BBJ28_00008996 [Nothophytophthora sp. Chile5]